MLHLGVPFLFGLATAGSLLSANTVSNPETTSETRPDWMTTERPGGNATVYSSGKSAYTHAFPGLSLQQRKQFSKGAEEFNAVWQAPPLMKSKDAPDIHTGLGPSFNGSSCAQCHVRDGRAVTLSGNDPVSPLVLQKGLPDGLTLPMQSHTPGVEVANGADWVGWESINVRLSEDGQFGSVEMRRPQMTSIMMAQAYPNLPMLRTAPAIFGLGMLEAIDDAQLLRRAALQPWAKYGIAGKIRWVTGPTTPHARPGRFGWKGEHANLQDQTARALLDEMGVTSPLLMDSAASNHGNSRSPEISPKRFGQLVAYMRFLGVPARQDTLNDEVLRGAVLFKKARCAMCHQPESIAGAILGTGSGKNPVRGQKIYPFTDLLLHDMGELLASGSGPWRRYWKTPALWGIGLQKQVAENAGFLHDGRARNLLEAILWHSGEAEKSRTLFAQMTEDERRHLLLFLSSL